MTSRYLVVGIGGMGCGGPVNQGVAGSSPARGANRPSCSGWGPQLAGERQVARLRARRFGRGRFRGLEIDVRQQRRRDDLGSQDLRQFDRVHDGAVLAAMTNDRVSSGLMNSWEF